MRLDRLHSLGLVVVAVVLTAGCKSAPKASKTITYVPVAVGTTIEDVVKTVGEPIARTPVSDGIKWTYENGTHVVVEGDKVIRTSGETIATTVSDTVTGGEAKTGSGG